MRITRHLFALLLAAPFAGAADMQVAATGLTVPFFDPAGRLTHRMAAREGVMVGPLQHLRDVEIVYFSPTDPTVVVQKLVAAEATWDDKAEKLAGRGAVEVTTDENRMSGTGFDFTLATAVLHIHRDFQMDNREVRLTSDRATVDLLLDRHGDEVKVRDVKRCEARGHLTVIVQPTARRRYPFDQAFSEVAVFDGATQVITFPEPLRYRRNGREATSSSLRMELRAPSAP
jgi:hypothetical protein